jgi:hypothetical protein
MPCEAQIGKERPGSCFNVEYATGDHSVALQVLEQSQCQEADSVQWVMEDKVMQSIKYTKDHMDGSLTMLEALVINFFWDMGITFERVWSQPSAMSLRAWLFG